MKATTPVSTADGSPTLYSETYCEHYHSLSGAYEESLHKFVYPSNVLEKSRSQSVKVLDICFGLGYNSLSTLEHGCNGYPINITAIEKDENVIERASNLSYPFKAWTHLMKSLGKDQEVDYKNGNIQLVVADARHCLEGIHEEYDVIYLDPFSTLKNPELWTYHFFKELKDRLKSDGCIVTYSSALPVQRGFMKCGLNVYRTQAVGRRRGGTIASLSKRKDLEVLSPKEQFLLEHSDGSIPYRDPKLQSSPEEILIKRKKLIKYLLKKKKIYKVKHCYKAQMWEKRPIDK